MANQGAKKRKDENARHMKNLRYAIIISNVIYLVVRAGFMYSSFKWKHMGGLLLTAFAYIIPYQQLHAMSRPTYSDDGELIDGGFDMSTGGICGYLHDVIYITCFVQLASIFSEKFWYIYLVIPAFAAYKLFGIFKGFLPSGGAEVFLL
ncbi:OLC1v1035296C1 [Oldenlandia corymbosa var. corymbosa]|uniref:OLC1v1035296C1 n=1 Tax=Oldenlandia corymbosa var. corymbosa TaxID=529605 RepID=A0AAV1CT58_OLDCO|nr:OLC1v1035296C1 [Oldenlandia corymbosa var. corymbosa]